MKTFNQLGIAFVFISLNTLALAQTTPPQLPAQLTTRPQMTVEYSLKTQPTPALECTGEQCTDHRAASGTCPAALEMDVYMTIEPTSNYIYYPQVSNLGIVANTPSGSFVGAFNNGAGSLNSQTLLPGKNLLGVIDIPVCGARSPNLGGWALSFGQDFSVSVRTNYGITYFSTPIVLFGMYNADIVKIPQSYTVLNQGTYIRTAAGAWTKEITE